MSETNERSVASTGSVDEPVAWVVGGPGGPRVFLSRDEAKQYMRDTLSMNLMCLYKQQPMRLTDAEVDAIGCAAMALERDDRPSVNRLADVLRGITGRAQVPHLTAVEREALEWFAEVPKPLARLTKNNRRDQYIATLRGLLERTKPHA